MYCKRRREILIEKKRRHYDDALLALKVEQGTLSQGLQGMSPGSLKTQGNDSPLEPPEGVRPR